MDDLDLRAMVRASFLPMLYWTGAVVLVTLLGYPGVVCMTPAAWLLGVPLGMRLQAESQSPAQKLLLEGGLAGGVLGLWQGLLFVGAASFSPVMINRDSVDWTNLIALALVLLILGVPAAGGLAALTAWNARRSNNAGPL